MVYLSPKIEFPLTQKKRSLFESCKHHLPNTTYRIHHGTIYIQMNWERLLLFGSVEQIKQFDRFRERYIHMLLDKHTKSIYECHIKVIGSKSPTSDIDINIWCKDNIETILYSIYQEHRTIYPDQSLEELFDINIYSTIYHYLTPLCTEVKHKIISCYPRKISSKTQRMWSFMRIVETFDKLPIKEKRFYISSWSCEYQTLYRDTVRLMTKTRTLYQRHDYVYYIQRYFYLLSQQHPKAPSREIANAFSVASFMEKDAYHSVGAVLHIVEQLPNLPKTVLYDSIYDNMGFIYQIMYHNEICVQEQPLVKLIKSTKYMYRIMDAMLHIVSKTHIQYPVIKQIFSLSMLITNKKKQMLAISEVKEDLSALLKQLSISTLSKETFLSTFTHFVFDTLPRDPLLSCRS